MNVTLVCVFRLGRRRCFLLSISLSCLLGVAVCLSSSVVAFLLLRLFQGATLAGVFVSSYIISEYPARTFSRPTYLAAEALLNVITLAIFRNRGHSCVGRGRTS